MPIDIALSTNSAVGALELRQTQPMPDGSGYAAFLIVRSGAFAAAIPWFVSREAWRDFVRALEAVSAVDGPPARLRARDSEDFIALAGAGQGQVAVFGTLHEADEDQVLRFRFVTSAKGVAAFVSGARRVE